MLGSDKFMVNSDAERMAAARYATENFAWQMKLDKHDTLRLDLLVEETLGMVKTMLEDFYGQIWFVGDGKKCEIHFEATADMDADKKDELLSVSSTGKNAAKLGFMVRLGRDDFRRAARRRQEDGRLWAGDDEIWHCEYAGAGEVHRR